MHRTMRLSFQRSLLLLLAGTTILALVPAGLALDRRVGAELEERARRSLTLAPRIFADRERARADVLKMHAMDLAAAPGLAAALEAGDVEAAARQLASAPLPPPERAVLLGPDGEGWSGPSVEREAFARARDGGAAMSYAFGGGELYALSLMPMRVTGDVVAFVGIVAPAGRDLALTLSGLTGSDVAILGPRGLVAATADSTIARALVEESAPEPERVREVSVNDERHWVVAAPLGEVGTVLFVRSASDELALLPALRKSAVLAGITALAVALLIGAFLSAIFSRRVTGLARAADQLADGDFEAPLQHSRVRELDRLATAFAGMRSALAARLEELRRANSELQDRQARLSALQAEMIQRDRLVASGRLVAELAHEIRNPVANVRNCLEVIRRQVGDEDPKMLEFADLAIDELLRMHELSERMLDLNRPLDPGASRCDVNDVVSQVESLYRAGSGGERWPMRVTGELDTAAAVGPDTLKQVLLNLVENAREAMPDGGAIEIRLASEGTAPAVEVFDEGPGISEEAMTRIFDPFYTTKGSARGVGLGLFVAEGLVRRAGGRLEAANRPDQCGARFRIELPPADASHAAGPAEGKAADGGGASDS